MKVTDMNGKEKCLYLRELRIKMAEQYGIDYIPHECNNTEHCSGTCPMCDKELSMLNAKIRQTLGLSSASIELEDEMEQQEEQLRIRIVFDKRHFSNPFQLRGIIEEE